MKPAFRGGSNEPTSKNFHFLTKNTAILPRNNRSVNDDIVMTRKINDEIGDLHRGRHLVGNNIVMS